MGLISTVLFITLESEPDSFAVRYKDDELDEVEEKAADLEMAESGVKNGCGALVEA